MFAGIAEGEDGERLWGEVVEGVAGVIHRRESSVPWSKSLLLNVT
jgi:hypothetical protein